MSFIRVSTIMHEYIAFAKICTFLVVWVWVPILVLEVTSKCLLYNVWDRQDMSPPLGDSCLFKLQIS